MVEIRTEQTVFSPSFITALHTTAVQEPMIHGVLQLLTMTLMACGDTATMTLVRGYI